MPGYGDEISTISLGSIIGGALNAIVEAQSQAANTTVDFIKSVGFQTGTDGVTREPVYVDFQYARQEAPTEKSKEQTHITSLRVPLLTMVPIPFIRIDDATIDFNVKINSVEATKSSSDTKYGGDTSADASYKGWGFKAGIKLNASFSNQKKSSTSDTVKRDYSLNVRVHAVQDEIPVGVERLLGLLEDATTTQSTLIEKKKEKEKGEA